MTIQIAKVALITALFVTTSVSFADVFVSGAWVRGTVKEQTETGAFMTLKSTEATQLLQVSSPIATMAQVHEMTLDKGMMKMRPVKALDVPANTAVILQPGGYHVMLMGLTKPLTRGDHVPLQFTFITKNGTKASVNVDAEVHDLTQANPVMNMAK